MDWLPINWQLIGNPLNWVIIILMIAFGAFALHLTLPQYFGNLEVGGTNN